MTTPINRHTGKTAEQMVQAPAGSVFVWCNARTGYPKHLAAHLGRPDLDIRPLSWLRSENVRGPKLSGLVIDHAAKLDNEGYEALHWARKHLQS